MFYYPDINPIAFKIGPFKVFWYGITYIVGLALAWVLALARAKKPHSGWTKEQVGDLIFYNAIGLVVGGRLGYMLFYDFHNFIANPIIIFKTWQGGMSFHGGLLGVAVATLLFAWRYKKHFFTVADFIAPLAPLGLGAGRIGNFINGELWGRITTMPWGMIYPKAGPLPRHPSEIYEFFCEGIVLFLILWFYSAKTKPRMAVSALFLLCYGCIRFFLEFWRQPDPQLGFVAFGWMTQGQLLSIPMIILGIILLYFAYRRKGRNPC